MLALLLAACSTPAAPTAAHIRAPAYDLAHVKATWTDECADPFVVDELFCDQVNIAGMTADGTILNVPTGLNPASRDRARVICDLLTLAHFDAEGDPLGYEIVGILDMNGGNLAACNVP